MDFANERTKLHVVIDDSGHLKHFESRVIVGALRLDSKAYRFISDVISNELQESSAYHYQKMNSKKKLCKDMSTVIKQLMVLDGGWKYHVLIVDPKDVQKNIAVNGINKYGLNDDNGLKYYLSSFLVNGSVALFTKNSRSKLDQIDLYIYSDGVIESEQYRNLIRNRYQKYVNKNGFEAGNMTFVNQDQSKLCSVTDCITSSFSYLLRKKCKNKGKRSCIDDKVAELMSCSRIDSNKKALLGYYDINNHCIESYDKTSRCRFFRGNNILCDSEITNGLFEDKKSCGMPINDF